MFAQARAEVRHLEHLLLITHAGDLIDHAKLALRAAQRVRLFAREEYATPGAIRSRELREHDCRVPTWPGHRPRATNEVWVQVWVQNELLPMVQ